MVDVETFQKQASVVKVDESLGLVMGWAIICKEAGEDYYDLQGDNIPEDAMIKAAADFMENSRVAKEMHKGDPVGFVVFAWPMTTDVAKSLGIQTERTGLLVGMRPSAEVLEKFRKGDLTGFSIGGERIEDEEVED